MWGKKCGFGRKLTDFRPNVGVKSIDLGEKRQYTYHRRQRGHAHCLRHTLILTSQLGE